MSELSVGVGTQITLHFSLHLQDGGCVDSNFDKAPASFAFGDGSLLPGFEEVLVGMTVGEKKQCVIPPEKAFGQPNPNNIQQIDRSVFDASMELAEGLVVSFADAAGMERPGVVSAVEEEYISVDFNHPLAGKSIVFDVAIVGIAPAVTH